jgi:hypothetical protein
VIEGAPRSHAPSALRRRRHRGLFDPGLVSRVRERCRSLPDAASSIRGFTLVLRRSDPRVARELSSISPTSARGVPLARRVLRLARLGARPSRPIRALGRSGDYLPGRALDLELEKWRFEGRALQVEAGELSSKGRAVFLRAERSFWRAESSRWARAIPFEGREVVLDGGDSRYRSKATVGRTWDAEERRRRAA